MIESLLIPIPSLTTFMVGQNDIYQNMRLQNICTTPIELNVNNKILFRMLTLAVSLILSNYRILMFPVIFPNFETKGDHYQ